MFKNCNLYNELIQKPLSYIGKILIKFVSANHLTIFGFWAGILMSRYAGFEIIFICFIIFNHKQIL